MEELETKHLYNFKQLQFEKDTRPITLFTLWNLMGFELRVAIADRGVKHHLWLRFCGRSYRGTVF